MMVFYQLEVYKAAETSVFVCKNKREGQLTSAYRLQRWNELM